MNSLTLKIASLPDRNNVVSEIWFDDFQVAEVSAEDGEPMRIEIYSAPNSGVWNFDFRLFEDILNKAKINLQTP